MQGIISFHPVDTAVFDGLLATLLGGGKVNPESFLHDAIRSRTTWSQARRFIDMIEAALEKPEPARQGGRGLWQNLRGRIEELAHRPDETAELVRRAVVPDLHLEGRPYFITEGSAESVADFVEAYRTARTPDEVETIAREQMVRLSPELAKRLELPEAGEGSADFAYRADLLADLKDLYDVGHAAREGGSWGRADRARRPAVDVLVEEIPWRAVRLHARIMPFWVARDVDGLETVCRAADISAPESLVPAWRLFSEACESFPRLRESLKVEIDRPRAVGAFVSPGDVAELLEFLTSEGARIIQVAARHGEGAACRTLLRKIRECATYAGRHGYGYLEAGGIVAPDIEPAD